MRLRKKPWIATAIEQFQDFVMQQPDEGLQGRWQEIFGGKGPLHVELGTGKGRFISEMAVRRPEVHFVGIEAQRDVLFYAAQKVRAAEAGNVRLLVFDINNLLEIFAPGEIDRLYINFCDPWPKSRHAKRRLTHSSFLAKYQQALKPGGQLFFKTDNAPLFAFSLEEFAAFGLKVDNVNFDLHNSAYQENVMTEYEAKFSGQGYKIHRCEVTF